MLSRGTSIAKDGLTGRPRRPGEAKGCRVVPFECDRTGPILVEAGASGAETASPYERWRVRPFGTARDAAGASRCFSALFAAGTAMAGADKDARDGIGPSAVGW